MSLRSSTASASCRHCSRSWMQEGAPSARRDFLRRGSSTGSTSSSPRGSRRPPTVLEAMVARAPGHEGVLARRRLRFIRTAAAPPSPQLLKELESVFRCPNLESYGMTEAQNIASNRPQEAARRSGSVGQSGGVRIGIMDDAGRLLDSGKMVRS